MFADAIDDLLQGYCTSANVREIEAGGDAGTLWAAFVDSGFLELLAGEEHGGAGLDASEALPVLKLLGAYAVPLPIGSSIVARALLSSKQLSGLGMITFAPSLVANEDGSLSAHGVPFGTVATHVIGELDGGFRLLDADPSCRRTPNLYRDSSCSFLWQPTNVKRATVLSAPATGRGSLEAWSAALYAALISGALERCFELALAYCNERMQFGRSIGKFQAVQHQLAVMAEHTAAAKISVEAAFSDGAPTTMAAALAKSRCSEAVSIIAPIAHAVHGAIGVTEEYDLQLLTRRLHAWRLAHGSEHYWNERIGRVLLEEPALRIGDFVRRWS